MKLIDNGLKQVSMGLSTAYKKQCGASSLEYIMIAAVVVGILVLVATNQQTLADLFSDFFTDLFGTATSTSGSTGG